MSKFKLTVIVVSYNMARELPRTLRTLSPLMQRDIAAEDYEIIVVDNGSKTPPAASDYSHICPNLRIHSVANPSISPVSGINEGLAMAQGDLVGVMIDGARMASPRLLAMAVAAAAASPEPVIGTLAFHLGPEVQMESVRKGYCQSVEDELLASVDWEADGYRLFEISVFAGSSSHGWFVIPAETNALFLARDHWKAIGGYDERFQMAGGGLVNLDMWRRLCERHRPTLLLGEATFHQFHGGVATNAEVSPWTGFHDEYVAIRGQPYECPVGTPLMFGAVMPAAMPSVRLSASLGAP